MLTGASRTHQSRVAARSYSYVGAITQLKRRRQLSQESSKSIRERAQEHCQKLCTRDCGERLKSEECTSSLAAARSQERSKRLLAT